MDEHTVKLNLETKFVVVVFFHGLSLLEDINFSFRDLIFISDIKTKIVFDESSKLQQYIDLYYKEVDENLKGTKGRKIWILHKVLV